MLHLAISGACKKLLAEKQFRRRHRRHRRLAPFSNINVSIPGIDGEKQTLPGWCRGTVLDQVFATEPVKYPLPKWHKETMTPAESGKRRHLQPHDSDQLHTLSGWWETLLGISNLYELHEIADNGEKNCNSTSVHPNDFNICALGCPIFFFALSSNSSCLSNN